MRDPRSPRPLPLRVAQFVGGLFIYACAASLTIRSGLGVGPWDAFHVGLHLVSGLSVGMAAGMTSLSIVALGFLVGVRPRIGTVGNALCGMLFIDPVLAATPAVEGPWRLSWAALYLAAGIGLTGLATGLYLGAAFGAGPRDGLMVGLAARFGWPVRRVRTAIELAALAGGWTMGGPLGVGTVLYALGIGPAVQWGVKRFVGVPPKPETVKDEVSRVVVSRAEGEAAEPVAGTSAVR